MELILCHNQTNKSSILQTNSICFAKENDLFGVTFLQKCKKKQHMAELLASIKCQLQIYTFPKIYSS